MGAPPPVHQLPLSPNTRRRSHRSLQHFLGHCLAFGNSGLPPHTCLSLSEPRSPPHTSVTRFHLIQKKSVAMVVHAVCDVPARQQMLLGWRSASEIPRGFFLWGISQALYKGLGDTVDPTFTSTPLPLSRWGYRSPFWNWAARPLIMDQSQSGLCIVSLPPRIPC